LYNFYYINSESDPLTHTHTHTLKRGRGGGKAARLGWCVIDTIIVPLLLLPSGSGKATQRKYTCELMNRRAHTAPPRILVVPNYNKNLIKYPF